MHRPDLQSVRALARMAPLSPLATDFTAAVMDDKFCRPWLDRRHIGLVLTGLALSASWREQMRGGDFLDAREPRGARDGLCRELKSL